MLSVAIVEDNESEMSMLKNALLRYKDESGTELIISPFCNAESFLTNYKPVYDTIFMDIELGGMNGMEAARKLRKNDEMVRLIFVTNIAQYALDGYKVGAMDYFLKPIAYFDLKMRMERIRRAVEVDAPRITIPISGGAKNVFVSEIEYIEVSNHTLTYHTSGGDYVARSESLKKLEKQLEPYDFARCNASYLVNMKKCNEISGNTVVVCGDSLQISRALHSDFTRKLSKTMNEGQ